MPDVTAERFIDVLESLHDKIDDGFRGVYNRMDIIEKETLAQRKHCNDRISVLEHSHLVKSTENGIRREYEQTYRDWWKWIIRGTTSVIALGAGALLWKILMGSARIVIG